ncbi:MAG: hypothetical protein ABJL67_05290, partial [Sulfitobacter sp.]
PFSCPPPSPVQFVPCLFYCENPSALSSLSELEHGSKESSGEGEKYSNYRETNKNTWHSPPLPPNIFLVGENLIFFHQA